LKISQNAAQGVYRLVPLQDFTPQSDIDWSKNVADIDQQLYTKYGLTDEEIAFIESTVKPIS
jgi:type II restriction enzyme